jgi:phosphoglycerate dehydrogenase-like enzyme
VARARPDLQFVLDVTEPEPPSADSPLWTLPNVELTPHIAGASGGELRRLARYMIEELERLVTGQPLRFAVNPPPQLVSPSLRPFISRRIRIRADQAAPVSPPTSGR